MAQLRNFGAKWNVTLAVLATRHVKSSLVAVGFEAFQPELQGGDAGTEDNSTASSTTEADTTD